MEVYPGRRGPQAVDAEVIVNRLIGHQHSAEWLSYLENGGAQRPGMGFCELAGLRKSDREMAVDGEWDHTNKQL
jgi:hypothetical protein